MCFSYRLDNDGESQTTGIAQLLSVRALRINVELEAIGNQQIKVRTPEMKLSPPAKRGVREPDYSFDPTLNRDYIEQQRANIEQAKRSLNQVQVYLQNTLTQLAKERRRTPIFEDA